jgi:release factor glutamine methyltransferase
MANLPYVKETELAETGFEPRLALDGGPDGTEKISQLCRQIDSKLHPDGYLLLEMGQGQKEAVTSIFPKGEIEVVPDLSGIERVLSFRPTNRDRVAK